MHFSISYLDVYTEYIYYIHVNKYTNDTRNTKKIFLNDKYIKFFK